MLDVRIALLDEYLLCNTCAPSTLAVHDYLAGYVSRYLAKPPLQFIMGHIQCTFNVA